MDRQPAAQRSQRLKEIAQRVGAVLNIDAIPLYPPRQVPTFCIPDDERRADAVLGQLKLEEFQSQQPSNRLSRTFTKNTKPTNYTYKELYAALSRVIEENGLPGVFEVLLRRFRSIDGDINVARRGSTGVGGMIGRFRNNDTQTQAQPGRLLQSATRIGQYDFVQLLAPLSPSQESLDESLEIALEVGALPIVEILLQYGANATPHHSVFRQAVKKGDLELLNLLVRAEKKPTEQCVSQNLLPAVQSGWLPVVMLLVRAGADGDYDNASALMFAVEMGRVDIAVAIVSGEKPPSGASLDRALDLVFSSPPGVMNDRVELIEILLCGGPSGNAANEGLFRCTLLVNYEIMQLLLAHKVDVNYNGAAAVAHAIQRNRGDLVGMLLQDQILQPEVASELIARISPTASSSEKVAILSKLLVNGASGTHCSMLLIAATEQSDLETARMLVLARDQNGSPICSVDYNGSRCLKIAVSRGNQAMLNILALDGVPSKFSLAKALSSIPPKISGDQHFLIVQTLLRAGAEGPEVDAALLAAVNAPNKSHRLIELLVQSGAVVTDQTLYGVVSQGSKSSVEILKLLLMGKTSAQICSSAIPMAMKIHGQKARFETIKLLLDRTTAAAKETPEVTQAVIEVLHNCPQDKPLLKLLCLYGKANINFQNGLAVELATKNEDPEVLHIVLSSDGGLPNAATVERALKVAIKLQATDPNRRQKVGMLLNRTKPQSAINSALVEEIKSAVASKQDLSVIQLLLAAGANVNAIDGASVFWGVRDPAIMDLLLSRGLNADSFLIGLRHAVGLRGEARYNLCEKLLRAGAPGPQISNALFIVSREGPSALPVMKLLLPSADVNFKDGKAMHVVVQNAFVEGLELFLSPRPIMPSKQTMASAFLEAMKLTKLEDRHKIVARLLRVELSKTIISDALITAVNHCDLKLAEILLQAGALVNHNAGQAVLCAASLGQKDLLKLLVSGKHFEKPSMSSFTSGFSGAMTLKEKDPESYHAIVEILLEAGARGDAISAALVDAVKEGDPNLALTTLLFRTGQASVEWGEGEALDIATRNASVQTLSLLLERQLSQETLKRAYRSATQLPKEHRYPVIEQILKAGKAIDKHVSNTLTACVRENPPDRQLLRLLLAHHAFDEGESLVHASRSLDLETLTLLVDTPRAQSYISNSFKEAMTTDFLWQSREGLAIVDLMLKHGATGETVGEALYQAIEKSEGAAEGLAKEFLEVLITHGADVNYQRGLALQRAALQVNVELINKLLPKATSESKAMAIPYLFSGCDDHARLFKAIQAFLDSLDGDDESVIPVFRHPDTKLDPVLFLALEHFPKRPQILRALLDLNYDPNQWILHEWDSEVDAEPWPVLLWALDQPEKRISNMNIELLIDKGANVNFKSKSGITPLTLAIENQRTEIVEKLISKRVNVKVPDQNGITPLSLASRYNNVELMEMILRAGAETNDGSLHDAARELRCDVMRILIKYRHDVDYPSERHEGRSALAELCLKGVNNSPDAAQLEEAVECLIAHEANYRLRCFPEDKPKKTLFHYALDSADPMLILPVLLKMMWQFANEDCFLYEDITYSYSLTMYVKKDVFEGPQDQKAAILKLLRNKRVEDRFWANDIMAEQPEDSCGEPEFIKKEAIRQKIRRKQYAEQHQDLMVELDLQKQKAVGMVKIMAITSEAEIQTEKERAAAQLLIMQERAHTQLRLEVARENEHMRLIQEKQSREVSHVRAIGEAQISTQRTIQQNAMDEERTKNFLQLEYMDSKIAKENEGRRAMLTIENNARENDEMIDVRGHEREMARIKFQKSLVDSSKQLASNLAQGGMSQRQIGYITGEVS